MKKESTKQPKKVLTEGSTEAFQARIQQLEMENEYLKKLNALVQAKEKSPQILQKHWMRIRLCQRICW